MDKRWYPAAFTAMLLGCGGSAGNGAEETGGSAGNSGIDAGAPSTTGGMVTVRYGVIAMSGGSPNATGGMTS